MQMTEVTFKPQFVSLVNSSHSVIKLGRITRTEGKLQKLTLTSDFYRKRKPI